MSIKITVVELTRIALRCSTLFRKKKGLNWNSVVYLVKVNHDVMGAAMQWKNHIEASAYSFGG